MDDLNAGITQSAGPQGGLDLVFLANQECRRDLGIRMQGTPYTFNDNSAAMVSPHDIHGDSHISQ
jgi:hypothetical protein